MYKLPYRRIMLLSAGAALVVAAILGAGAGLIWQMRETAFRDATESVEKINLVLAEQAARMLQGADLVLTELIKDIDAHDFADAARLRAEMSDLDSHQELRQRMSGVPQLDALFLADPEGDIIATTRSYPAVEVNVADRDYLVAVRDNDKLTPFISAPVQSRVTGAWTIYLARRVNARDGGFLGLVVGAIALSSFETFYEHIYLGDNVAISMWRSDATLLARFPKSSNLTGKPVPAALKNITALLRGKNNEGGTDRVMGAVNPTPLLLTVRRVPGYPLYTTISLPQEAILARWRQASAPVAVGGVLISIAIGVIAWLLLRQFAIAQRAIEARSQLVEATAALAQAEALSRAKSEFLAHMSHELRTPLNAIIGFAEIMRDEMMGKLGAPQYKGYARDIYLSGKNLLGIVNDVLDFSQANAGGLLVERQTVELHGIIESVSSMFRVVVDKADLAYAVEIEPMLPAVVGDEKRIKQVLVNLIGNAIKFTPAGGSVRVIARSVRPSVEIRIEDTGVGISPENLAKVFEPFGFLDMPLLAQKNRGAGLGLPICKRLVELLGGTLTLNSAASAGTVATVTLPVAPQPGMSMAAE